MIIYLLFIFTCGWCVCWLLFLNYQQYTRDSERDQLKSRYCSLNTDGQNVCGRSSYLRRLRRRLRLRGEKRLQNGLTDTTDEELLNNNRNNNENDFCSIAEQGEISNTYNDDADYDGEFEDEINKSRFECQLIGQPQARMVNFVVDQDGDHTILAQDNYDQLELNYYSPYQEDCELVQSSNLALGSNVCGPENLSLLANGSGFICSECGATSSSISSSSSSSLAARLANNIGQQQLDLSSDDLSFETTSKMTINGQIVRGWPEKFSSMSDDLFQASQLDVGASKVGRDYNDDDEEGGLLTMWPLVELHENPLNSLLDEQQQQQKQPPLGSITTCSGSVKLNCERGVDLVSDSKQVVDDAKEIEALLDRSRLLSLREGQRQNRAAIRMVSRLRLLL